MPTQPPPLNPRVLWILHFAFMATVPIYAVLYHLVLLPQKMASGGLGEPNMVAYILPIMALLTVPLGFIIPELIAKGARKQANQPMNPAINFVRLIFSDAMFEAIAVYGLVGIFLGTSVWLSYSMMGFSMLLLLINAVRIRGWLDDAASTQSPR